MEKIQYVIGEQDKKIILAFLSRITLNASEIPAYNRAIEVLNKRDCPCPSESPQKPATPAKETNLQKG